MGAKFSKKSKGQNEEKKWDDYKLEGRSKYSTLPASFRRKTDENEDVGNNGTLPRNLKRNESFNKRVRKSIRSWASQKGLIDPCKVKVVENTSTQSQESTKPSSVVLGQEEFKIDDIDPINELTKNKSMSDTKIDKIKEKVEVIVETKTEADEESDFTIINKEDVEDIQAKSPQEDEPKKESLEALQKENVNVDLKIKAEDEEAARKNSEEEETAREKAEEEEAARKKAEEEEAIRKKSEEEEAARKKAEEEEAARIKAEEEEAARKKAEEEEAARIKAEAEEAARIKAEEEEAARVKAEEEEAARIKAEEEAAKKKAEEEEAARIKAEEEAAARFKAEEAARKKAEEEEAARIKAEVEEAARIKAKEEEAARIKAEEEEEAKIKAEEEEAAKIKAEEEEAARIKAEEEEAARIKDEQEIVSEEIREQNNVESEVQDKMSTLENESKTDEPVNILEVESPSEMNDSKYEEALDETEVQTNENAECSEEAQVIETSLTESASVEQRMNEGSELLSLCDPVWKHQWNSSSEDQEQNSVISTMISHVVTGGVDGTTTECASLVAHVVERSEAVQSMKEIVEDLVEDITETPSTEEDTKYVTETTNTEDVNAETPSTDDDDKNITETPSTEVVSENVTEIQSTEENIKNVTETLSTEEDKITADDVQGDSNAKQEISNDCNDVPKEDEKNIISDDSASDNKDVNDVERIVTEIDC